MILIGDVVRKAAVRICGVHGPPLDAGEEAKADGEIRTMLMGNGATLGIGLIDVHDVTGPSGGTFISVSRERHQ